MSFRWQNEINTLTAFAFLLLQLLQFVAHKIEIYIEQTMVVLVPCMIHMYVLKTVHDVKLYSKWYVFNLLTVCTY